MKLHPELVIALCELKACGVMDEEAVFKRIPRIERFRRDLIKAGIAPTDAQGRKAVFHSLRHLRNEPRPQWSGQPRGDGAHAAQ